MNEIHINGKAKIPRRDLNSVCLHGSRKGIGLCGLSWPFFSPFYFLKLFFFFLLSSLEKEKRKIKNCDEFFFLDRKKKENIWEEGATIYKLLHKSTAQNVKESQGSEKCSICHFNNLVWFFSECHLTSGSALSLQNRTSSAMHAAWSVLHTTILERQSVVVFWTLRVK